MSETMKIRLPLIVFVFLGLVSAEATTLVRMSLEQLSQAATAIVRGRVVKQESQWNADHTQILTLTTVAVEDTMKGHPPATVVVQQLGGGMGNVRVRVPGSVTLQPQESYVLFLEPAGTNPARYLVVGMSQGSYRVFRDATTHEERLIAPLTGFTAAAGSNAPPSGRTLSMRDFRQSLAAAMKPTAIPRGTALPVAIQSSDTRGVGRLRLTGRTTTELYPSPNLVIPAGSLVEGTAQLVSGAWKIHWTELEIRGARVGINATSEEHAGSPLRGRTLVINVR